MMHVGLSKDDENNSIKNGETDEIHWGKPYSFSNAIPYCLISSQNIECTCKWQNANKI